MLGKRRGELVLSNLKKDHTRKLIEAERLAASKIGRKAAQSRYSEHTTDKKQLAKKQVKECWDLWQIKPDSYANKSKFARAMLDKYEALESQKVIVSWCGGWAK
jgi:hypothetical protein